MSCATHVHANESDICAAQDLQKISSRSELGEFGESIRTRQKCLQMETSAFNGSWQTVLPPCKIRYLTDRYRNAKSEFSHKFRTECCLDAPVMNLSAVARPAMT